MTSKLNGADTDPAELAALLDELEQRGWLSEQRLAEQHVARARGRYGAGRVLRDLSNKGVAAEILEQTAAVLKRSELEQARAVWRKRFGVPAADAKERARQWRFLHGRGFSAEVIRQVVGGEWGDE